MSFLPLVRFLSQAPLTAELCAQVEHPLLLKGLSRLAKGLIGSALAQYQCHPLCVITATLEEAGRWSAQLEAMGWRVVHFYPTSEASPYEPYDVEPEIVWGQFQALADLIEGGADLAVVATERALQPHLPPPEVFQNGCLKLTTGFQMRLQDLGQHLSRLGYERVNLVETEGQWSQRGDIIDIFPVASEWPVRLEWFGDELEKLREFDPVTQRSQDAIPHLLLTPTSYAALVRPALLEKSDLPAEVRDALEEDPALPGMRRYLGMAFAEPVGLAAYLGAETLMVIDEPEQCRAHSRQWYDHADDQWQQVREAESWLVSLHRSFDDCLTALHRFSQVHMGELATVGEGLDFRSRPISILPHQFGQLAKQVRDLRKQGSQVWMVSAQPSRMVALLQEHDCPSQFVPNPRDFPALDRLVNTATPIALKYKGLAELEGFVLPRYGLVLLTDREFFGQHSLASPSYVRKRRQASSRQVDPNALQTGDYVVHRAHGIGRFQGMESRSDGSSAREYLVIQYEDGVLRVAADQVNALSRYRTTSDQSPQLNRMSKAGMQSWEKTKNKVKKAVEKVAADLLDLYAKRAEQKGFTFPIDSPWQQELEDSFPYQATPDQIKAIQEVKQDMEGERPMDRLVCGDVGFGKTEVAIRAIFKAVEAGKQVALLAPTTILTQQHYHTLKERFAPYPIQVGLLNRFRTHEEKKEIITRLKTGELDVVVGTHQLLGKEVNFQDLGLLVIDEEQRFGVKQKEKIKTIKTQVDVLTLSATPIPRTLYMSLSGVREMSLITTPPPARRPIKTHLSPYRAEAVHAAIRQELDRGGQVFYVVNRIEGIEETCGRLREMIPGCQISIAHGQMPEGELEATMLSFNNGETEILVCTKIIETGLDIPRVNTILIENAETFGLAELYQLRGRVGRSGVQAHAWLFFRDESRLTEDARKRLRAIQEFTQLGSGYQLAVRDMEIRGVGNLLGTQQSGQMNSVGFDLYMEMLQEAIKEIRGQEIPEVDDTQIDLAITAMIPQSYIPDGDQKLRAYRQVAAAGSRVELAQIMAEWTDRFGPVPTPVQMLFQVMELKLLAKSLGFARIKPAKEHVVLETPMAEPAWQRLKEGLPSHLQSRFVYQTGKVTVRGLGQMPAPKQVENLIQWLEKLVAYRHQQTLGTPKVLTPTA
jgi:transcription-repair coupling factor (superfamily II helicase)